MHAGRRAKKPIAVQADALMRLGSHRSEVELPLCQTPGQALDTFVTESLRHYVRRHATQQRRADQRRTRLVCRVAVFHDAARWIQVRMGGTVMLAPEQPIQLRS
jgi:hypothetical protein